jgi:hypothetical protein
MPQGRVKIVVTGAPKRPVKPRRLQLLTYSGAPLIRSVAKIVAIVRRQCAGVLTATELERVLGAPNGAPSRKTPVLVTVAGKGPAKQKKRL